MNRRVEHFIDVVIVLTHKDLKVRYKSSYLGYLWSVAHPLAFGLVFFFAFKVVMKVKIPYYTLFLVTGLFPWQWFANSITTSINTFLHNGSLIKKVSFPRSILIVSVVLQDMIHFILALPVVVLVKFLYDIPMNAAWLYGVPILLVLHLCLVLGVALAVASVNLFFRDLERLCTIAVTLLFYLTPVVYPDYLIPDKFKPFILLNPMAVLILNWRSLLSHGHLDGTYLLASVAYAGLALMLGSLIYRKLSWKFAEVL